MRGFDPNALFAQAKKMKESMARVEKELEDRMVEGQAGGGGVRVVMNGNSQVKAVRIQPEAVDPEDLGLLEDLLLLAIREALQKAGKLHEEALEKVTGGMKGGLPGLL